MDDHSACNEVLRGLLGEIKDRLFAGLFNRRHLVGELVTIHPHLGVEPSQGGSLGALRVEADLPLEQESRAAADPERMHLLYRVRLHPTQAIRHDAARFTGPAIRVQFRFDAEPQQQQVHLLQKLTRGGIQSHILGFVAVVGDRSIRGEEPAQQGCKGGPIQLVYHVRESLARRPLIEDCELAE